MDKRQVIKISDKKYYWLKLKKDFFKRHDIQIIEAMPNGKDYILFYLKMLVESVDHDGHLRFNDTIPYNENMLSTITNTNIDIVRSAMKVFTDLKMIEVLEDSTIYMAEVEKMLGTETYWAAQKRKQKQAKLIEGGKCPQNVQTISNESNQELDIDIDIDIDKEILYIPYQSIIDYLNIKAGTKYKHSSAKTKTLIHARWVEKFTEQDFYTVIDNKIASWLNDPTMNKFLRPETLFGTKFEGYLNELKKGGANGKHSGCNEVGGQPKYETSKLVNTGEPVNYEDRELDF